MGIRGRQKSSQYEEGRNHHPRCPAVDWTCREARDPTSGRGGSAEVVQRFLAEMDWEIG